MDQGRIRAVRGCAWTISAKKAEVSLIVEIRSRFLLRWKIVFLWPQLVIKCRKEAFRSHHSITGLSAVAAHKINFSNIPSSLKKSEPIPRGYEGFSWTNYKYIDEEIAQSDWQQHFGRQRAIATAIDISASMYVERISGEVFTLGAIEIGSNVIFDISLVLTGEVDGKQLYCKPAKIEKGQLLVLVLNWTSIKRFGIGKDRSESYLYDPVIYSLTIGKVVGASSSPTCCALSWLIKVLCHWNDL